MHNVVQKLIHSVTRTLSGYQYSISYFYLRLVVKVINVVFEMIERRFCIPSPFLLIPEPTHSLYRTVASLNASIFDREAVLRFDKLFIRIT